MSHGICDCCDYESDAPLQKLEDQMLCPECFILASEIDLEPAKPGEPWAWATGDGIVFCGCCNHMIDEPESNTIKNGIGTTYCYECEEPIQVKVKLFSE